MFHDACMATAARRRTLDDLFAAACATIERFEPKAALSASADGALIVDIRSSDARRREGVVPGSLHIPRTVLEWRVDPDSPWRNPHVGGLDQRLIVLCDHGFSSALAAATLVELGFRGAGDVIGGFAAWQEAGLPVREARSAQDGLPGMGVPEAA